MNVIFEINKKKYQLKGGSHDFILSEYLGTKKDKEGNDVENTKLIGYFGDPFRALQFIPNYQALNSEAKTFLELSEMYKTMLTDIQEIVEKFKGV